MRRYQCLATLRPMTLLSPYSCVKFVAISCLCVGMLHVLSHGFNNFQSHYKSHSITERSSILSWHCELNKRMINELQKQLKEKDRLLNYRAKVIFGLRDQLGELNKTQSALQRTLKNITEVLYIKKSNTDENITYKPSAPYPENIADKVNKQARPCCIALKRMTDILRVYMETTDDLRDQLDAYQRYNFTERLNEIAEQEKLKYEALNCSERFLHNSKNLTKKQERHSVYQMYSNGFFYETFPENRIEPKQKFKHKSYHRNIDFSKVVNVGLQEILQSTKLKKELFVMKDAIIRYDELKGAEYKLTFYYNRTKSYRISLAKPYASYLFTEPIFETTGRHKELINIIIPISGRVDRLLQFLENFRNITLNDDSIFLTVVIYGTDPQNAIKNVIRKFSRENNFRNFDILKKNVAFNRGHALHDGIMRWNGYPNVLLFLCDVDITFDISFLSRCRKYSELGRSVYMPIVFSLYNPSIVLERHQAYRRDKIFNITTSTGTWRPLGYGMLCVYKPDYLRVDGFNLRIKGWGGEDVSLYNRFIKRGVRVIRAPDPGLYHVWHPKLCDRTLSKRQYETCLGSKARYEGSQRQLGILLFSDRKR